jgi:hypothetical protein
MCREVCCGPDWGTMGYGHVCCLPLTASKEERLKLLEFIKANLERRLKDVEARIAELEK